MTNEELYQIAKDASYKTYSPYSKFAVGAAILTYDEQIFIGTNIENASYSITQCAERVAIGNLIMSGGKNIKAIAIYADVESIPPCGACRQALIEFNDNIDVIFKLNGEVVCKKITELLPYKFIF